MSKNRERAVVCNRVHAAGFRHIRDVAEQSKVSLARAADVLLKIKDACEDKMLGGKAQFTGNNRRYGNGAIAVEIRCKKCKLTFWETKLPYALCVDCRRFKR